MRGSCILKTDACCRGSMRVRQVPVGHARYEQQTPAAHVRHLIGVWQLHGCMFVTLVPTVTFLPARMPSCTALWRRTARAGCIVHIDRENYLRENEISSGEEGKNSQTGDPPAGCVVVPFHFRCRRHRSHSSQHGCCAFIRAVIQWFES